MNMCIHLLSQGKIIVMVDIKNRFLKYKWRGAIASLFFLLSMNTLAQIKVVIIDTGFCTGITEIDATNTLNNYCPNASKERLHGKRVLNTFLKELNSSLKSKVVLTGITVFDTKGQQKVSYWKNALAEINKIKPDLVISSVALPLKSRRNPFPDYTYTTFTAAARKQRRIKKDTIFWPHEWKTSNFIVIGSFVGGIHDKRELYQDKTDYFFNYSSSIGNGFAAARALNLCSESLMNLGSCIKTRSKSIGPKPLGANTF